MKIAVLSGSRADAGLLEPVVDALQSDIFFKIVYRKIWGQTFDGAFADAAEMINNYASDVILLLGDRFEILAAATAAHLQRTPIAHIGGGDLTLGSYDNAMRDCISRMASIHFVTSTSAMARLTHMGCTNIHLTGSPGIDYIKHADWKRARPHQSPYLVVSYQPETIDGTNEMAELMAELPADKLCVFIHPNPDRGSGEIRHLILNYCESNPFAVAHEYLSHPEFLNLIYHCDEFIGNSSAMLYEAPELGVKTRMIGKRQKGRVIPMGDGLASQRIIKALKYASF